GVDVNLRAAGGALLGVIHGGVDAQLLSELGRRRRQAVAVGAVDRSADGRRAANRGRAGSGGSGGAAAADVEVITLRIRAAGALAVEEVGRVDTVDLEGVGCVALSVGP